MVEPLQISQLDPGLAGVKKPQTPRLVSGYQAVAARAAGHRADWVGLAYDGGARAVAGVPLPDSLVLQSAQLIVQQGPLCLCPLTLMWGKA